VNFIRSSDSGFEKLSSPEEKGISLETVSYFAILLSELFVHCRGSGRDEMDLQPSRDRIPFVNIMGSGHPLNDVMLIISIVTDCWMGFYKIRLFQDIALLDGTLI